MYLYLHGVEILAGDVYIAVAIVQLDVILLVSL